MFNLRSDVVARAAAVAVLRHGVVRFCDYLVDAALHEKLSILVMFHLIDLEKIYIKIDNLGMFS